MGTCYWSPVGDHSCSYSKMAAVISHPEDIPQLSRKGNKSIDHCKLLKEQNKVLILVSKPRSCSIQTHPVGKRLLWCSKPRP